MNKKVNLLNRNEQEKIGELTQFNGYVKNNIKPAITNSKKQIIKNQKSLKLENRLIINNLETYKKLKGRLKIIKTEERTLYKSQQKSKPILLKYDNKLKQNRTKVNELNNKINNIEKEIVNKNFNKLDTGIINSKSEKINFHPLLNNSTVTLKTPDFIKFMVENNKKITIFSLEKYEIIEIIK